MEDLNGLETPCVLLDVDKTQANIERMQKICDEHHVELRPHIKTHKMVGVAKMQLAAGAAGLTCAKIGEAEAMVPSGVKSIFIANSIADPLKAPRLKALSEQVDELFVAVTSERHAQVLEKVLAAADLTLPVMMAIDTGLHREGARSLEDGVRLAALIKTLPHMRLHGIYTHEGHAYKRPPAEREMVTNEVHQQIIAMRDKLDVEVKLWPGCSVTAALMAKLPGVDAVRPGAYMFGDHALARRVPTMEWDDIALTVLATVVDRPEDGLALIDAGSKVFSSDKTPDGDTAFAADGRDIVVSMYSEEHGFLTGSDVDSLEVGDKVRFVVAHVCPVLNLTDEVVVIENGQISGTWPVEARGCVR